MGSPNVFGGQVLGQSLYAASMTVSGRRPHLAAAFLVHPARQSSVADHVRRRAGTRWRQFQLTAPRGGNTRGAPHFRDVGVVPAKKEEARLDPPETDAGACRPGYARVHAAGVAAKGRRKPSSVSAGAGGFPFGWQRRVVRQRFTRAVQASVGANPDAPAGRSDGACRESVCLRIRLRLAVDILLALAPHGIKMGDPRLQIASLDHTIWFHRPFRMDEWLLFSMESPNASGGRGLCFAHVYDRQGALVATVAQEGLIRLRDKPKK